MTEANEQRVMNWVRPMWSGSMKTSGGWAHSSSAKETGFDQNQGRLIHILIKPPARVLLLSHLRDSGVYFGFACGAPRNGGGTILHYLAIKSSFRRFGLGKILLNRLTCCFPEGPLEFTHTTRSWRTTTASKKGLYNPYRAVWAAEAS